MTQQSKCKQCNEQFKDGDLIEQAGKDNFHSYHNRRSYVNLPGIIPDCFEAFVKAGHVVVSSRGPLVFYKGELYTRQEMNILVQTGVDLSIERNIGGNGHKVIGDLSGLV
ncbi:MAG: hypothetical protein ABIH37_05940 [archaeon]